MRLREGTKSPNWDVLKVGVKITKISYPKSNKEIIEGMM